MCATAGDEQPYVGVLESKGTLTIQLTFFLKRKTSNSAFQIIVKYIFVESIIGGAKISALPCSVHLKPRRLS